MAVPLLFRLVDAYDHTSPLLGATPIVTISKNGGTFASPAGAISEVGNGLYKVAPNDDDQDTNGPIWLHAVAGGSDPMDDIVADITGVVPPPPTEAIKLCAHAEDVLGLVATETVRYCANVFVDTCC